MKQIPYAHQSIDSNDIRETLKVLRSDWLTQGPKIKEFEDAICCYTGARYAVAVSSGTAALHSACLAAGIAKGDEVITSPVTFVASANCILYCSGKPVFADIQEDTVNICPDEIIKKITKKTKAIIPVHFAGHPCDLEKIHAIARKKKLIVIEDAAHSLGAEYKGARIGNCKYSDMAILSFHPAKHITTGEGGMVLTNNRDFYEKLLILRNHGITKDPGKLYAMLSSEDKCAGWYYQMQFLGYNYRLTDIQSALGIAQLTKIKSFILRRRNIAETYMRAFKEIDDITLPIEKKGRKSSWHIFVIKVKKNRGKIFAYLKKSGIGVNVHYIPIYLHPYYRSLGYKAGECLRAEDYYAHAITIPLYPTMKKTDINFVIRNVKDAVKRFYY